MMFKKFLKFNQCLERSNKKNNNKKFKNNYRMKMLLKFNLFLEEKKQDKNLVKWSCKNKMLIKIKLLVGKIILKLILKKLQKFKLCIEVKKL